MKSRLCPGLGFILAAGISCLAGFPATWCFCLRFSAADRAGLPFLTFQILPFFYPVQKLFLPGMIFL
jgi:hypothetical protein